METRSAGTGGLVERDESLAALAQALAGVGSTGEGRLVLVGGEAGVGKTSLVRRFCETQPATVRVLWGACEPLRTPRPLGPLVDVAEATGGELASVMAGAARPYEVVAALLAELRRRSPAIVVLEDVHWADEATLDVLTLLASRARRAPALVLATYRDDELDPAGQLRVLLGELVRRPGRLGLARLSPDAVAQLAAPYGVDAEGLYRRTGGNPFFVEEVLATGGERIPETVRDAVLARAARLTPPARRLLDAVAIVPGQVELWLLDRLDAETVEHVDACLAVGMLTASDTHVAFRHELARLALEAAVTPARRLALHRSALAALAARGGDPARLSHHAGAAGDAEALLRWAPRAAERAAASGAHREAAEQYARALAVAERLAPAERAGLLRRRAHECYLTAEFDEAIAAERGALDCLRACGDRLGEGDALRSLSRLLFFAGRAPDAAPLVARAVELLEHLPAGHELALAYGNVAQRCMVLEDVAGAERWGARAIELAERLDDREALVYALASVGASELIAGRPAGEARLEQALALARAADLDEYAGRVWTLLVLGSLRGLRLERAAEHLAGGLDYCRERGLETWRLYLLAYAAQLELRRGRWTEAVDAADAVVRDRRRVPVARGLALATLGTLRTRRGDPRAGEPLEEADELVRASGELLRIAPVAAGRAEAAWLAGEHGAVEELTGPALALALECGAGQVVSELAVWRRRAGLRDELPDGLLVEPHALSLAGRWREAAQRWRALGCPYEAALALTASDEPDALRQAAGELRELGAARAEDLVAGRLRAHGVRIATRRPRASTRRNPAGLTARELEVLVLLSRGLRNSEIGARLVLSERTVDHHVSAILRKLDVRSRGQAGLAAVRLGLVDEQEEG